MTSNRWAAPTAGGPVRAAVTVPGSKSVTNRALLLAALATGPSRLRRPLRSRDTELMAAALRALGASVADDGDDWVVTPAPLHGPASIDVGLAGTVMRFVPPVAALATGPVRFDGDPRARERPLRPLLEALRTLGADIDDGGRGGLPLTVVGHGGLPGGEVSLDASASSQQVSALLLAAPAYDAGAAVRHVGDRPVPNAPHLAMTVRMLRDRGARVEARRAAWLVKPGPVGARDEHVEPDLSSAAPFAAAAVVTGGEVRVRGWPSDTAQPGGLLPTLLERFGATCARDGDDLLVRGGDVVDGIEVDLRDAGELTPVVAAVAALARTPSRLTGIGYLRGHETDRLAALARELTALGGAVEETDDGLSIEPRRLHGGTFHSYADHRMVMAAAVVALVVPGVVVDDVAATAKTYPGFAAAWAAMLAGDAR